MYDEKPKRSPAEVDDLKAAYREFYRQLFVALMIPALLLGGLFALPPLLLNQLPAQVADIACTTAQQSLRLTLADYGTPRAELHVALSNDDGNTWQSVFSTQALTDFPPPDCALAQRDTGHSAVIYGDLLIVVRDDRAYQVASLQQCERPTGVQSFDVQDSRMVATLRCAGQTQETVIMQWDHANG